MYVILNEQSIQTLKKYDYSFMTPSRLIPFFIACTWSLGIADH